MLNVRIGFCQIVKIIVIMAIVTCATAIRAEDSKNRDKGYVSVVAGTNFLLPMRGLVGQAGLGIHVLSGHGIIEGYAGFLDNWISSTEYQGLRILLFPIDSFYFAFGGEQQINKAEYLDGDMRGYGEHPSSSEIESHTTVRSVAGSAAIGNRWQSRYFTLGIEWISYQEHLVYIKGKQRNYRDGQFIGEEDPRKFMWKQDVRLFVVSIGFSI